MRPLGKFVVVKQTMTSKASKIILDGAKNDKDKFNYDFKVEMLGPDCVRGLQVGDNPIFSEYAQFSSLKLIEKTDKKMVSLVLIHEDHIIAVDDTDPVEDIV